MADKKRRTARSAKSRAAQTEPAELAQSSIAARAYNLWIARGCPISDGQEDWFAARAELLLEAPSA